MNFKWDILEIIKSICENSKIKFCIQIPVEALHMKGIAQSEILQHTVLHPKKGLSKFRYFRRDREF